MGDSAMTKRSRACASLSLRSIASQPVRSIFMEPAFPREFGHRCGRLAFWSKPRHERAHSFIDDGAKIGFELAGEMQHQRAVQHGPENMTDQVGFALEQAGFDERMNM